MAQVSSPLLSQRHGKSAKFNTVQYSIQYIIQIDVNDNDNVPFNWQQYRTFRNIFNKTVRQSKKLHYLSSIERNAKNKKKHGTFSESSQLEQRTKPLLKKFKLMEQS